MQAHIQWRRASSPGKKKKKTDGIKKVNDYGGQNESQALATSG